MNIQYSHMNHWKNIPYKRIDNFREFYYEDKTNAAYYTDWDRVLRYQKALGFSGIELAPWDFPEMLPLFGSPQAFKDFAAERGVEVSGMFHLIDKAHDRTHAEVFQRLKTAYGVDIVYDAEVMKNCSVTAPLGDESLFTKLTIICKTIGARYEIVETEIVVSGRGCP